MSQQNYLFLKKDGINWIEIGIIKGAKAEVDIEKFINQDDVYSYVRLVDLKTECKGMWPGADIDAIATIGSAKRISFSSSVLFNINESILKPEAKNELDDLIEEINKASIANLIIEGYTESNPLFSNKTKEGQEKNRRVEVILIPQ